VTDVAVSYPADGNALNFRLEDDSFWFRHRNRCIGEAVRQFPPGGDILDVGGGNGFVARALIDAGFATVLLEPGPQGAANARAHRGIPDVINATLEDAGLARASVAAAGLFDVLEHIDDDRGFLSKLHDALVPRGHIYVTVPAHQALWSVADVEAGHFRRYSTTSLSACFHFAGFDVLYATYFFEILIAPLFLVRTLPFRLGLAGPRSAGAYNTEHTGGGSIRGLLERMLAREVAAIGRQRTLLTGTSCLLVARKRP